MRLHSSLYTFFFFNDPATTEIYPLPLPDALPICEAASASDVEDSLARSPAERPCQPARTPASERPHRALRDPQPESRGLVARIVRDAGVRSEEHTSELQSQSNLVCRLLLEKTKTH